MIIDRKKKKTSVQPQSNNINNSHIKWSTFYLFWEDFYRAIHIYCHFIKRYMNSEHSVGWSDLALFAIFEKLHVSADLVYFFNSKKSANFPAKFSFSKNRRDLKNEY